jgi:ubiquinone/menaquinone biosynthesis C-methylase UbiE
MAEAAANPSVGPKLDADSLRRMHRAAIQDAAEIRALLSAVAERKIILRNGIDRRSAERTALVVQTSPDAVTLRVRNIAAATKQLFFNFECDGKRFFLACRALESRGDELIVTLPTEIYEAERRDLRRTSASALNGANQVEIRTSSGAVGIAELRDWSYDGLGIAAPPDPCFQPGTSLSVQFTVGPRAGTEARAEVRNLSRDSQVPGWTRLGLSVSSVPARERISPEIRSAIIPRNFSNWQRLAIAGSPVRIARRRLATRLGMSARSIPKVVEYSNQLGQRLVGILDRTGEDCETAVVVPPSWGRTKETFLPLAKTLVRMFGATGDSLAVLRFDGTNRRGESYIDPRSRTPGDEYLGFTFSQAVADIHSSIAYLERTMRPKRIVLVTFSLASIEGRRAVATDTSGLVKAWISVVGMPDLQSGLRAVSGGIDYAHSLFAGVRMGFHELVGVLADMDRTGSDALRHQLGFLEDARRDMAAIRVPVTWLHGKHDGWIDIDRVATLMSSGEIANRRLIEIPTGHELRTSIEALETFQLVGTEIGRLTVGRVMKPLLPDLAELEASRAAERRRRPAPQVNARRFWRDYLLGTDGDGGMQSLAASTGYRRFMNDQLDALKLRAGCRVVDLGAGLGEFAASLERADSDCLPASITEVDLVADVLRRSRARYSDRVRPFSVLRTAADLDLRETCIPLRSGRADAALLSLVLSYLNRPDVLLRDVHRVLLPGGRLVVSSMRKDADLSRVYAEGVAEARAFATSEKASTTQELAELDTVQREFLNNAARLMDLEERGLFRFYEGDELRELLETAGFVDITITRGFGDPPQAVIAACIRP